MLISLYTEQQAKGELDYFGVLYAHGGCKLQPFNNVYGKCQGEGVLCDASNFVPGHLVPQLGKVCRI